MSVDQRPRELLTTMLMYDCGDSRLALFEPFPVVELACEVRKHEKAVFGFPPGRIGRLPRSATVQFVTGVGLICRGADDELFMWLLLWPSEVRITLRLERLLTVLIKSPDWISVRSAEPVLSRSPCESARKPELMGTDVRWQIAEGDHQRAILSSTTGDGHQAVWGETGYNTEGELVLVLSSRDRAEVPLRNDDLIDALRSIMSLTERP